MSPPTSPNLRRNFTLGIIAGVFVNVGMTFLDPLTVLPVFVTKLGGSATLVGLVSALHGVGWFLPQVFASRLAETRRYVIHLFRLLAVARALAVGVVAASVFVFDTDNMELFLPVFVLALLSTHIAGGLSAVPFLEIISKSIPVHMRGAFFGTRRLIGGTLGIGVGVIVGLVLGGASGGPLLGGPVFGTIERLLDGLGLMGRQFPYDFGAIFVMGAVFLSLAGFVFSLAREEPARSVTPSSQLLSHIRAGAQLIARDAHYRRFYLVRICWQLTAMAFPFYVGAAIGDLHLSESLVGLFLSVSVGSGVLSNTIWAHLLDRAGNKIVLLLTAAMSALPPLIILVVTPGGGGAARSAGVGLLLAACATFLINGFIRSGRIISNITYLLEFAPEDKRPLYVGFMNSFSFPLMFSPLLGGVVVQFFGSRTLFVISLLFAVLNTGLSLRLREPRHRAA